MNILQKTIILILIQGYLSQIFKYGQHYPYGVKSVDYLYSESGTWKFMGSIQYKWNYYNYTDNPQGHPYNKNQLIQYANGTHNTTCRDANKHILLDYNHDGEIDVDTAGYAFCEHYGRGVNNTVQGNPFSNFWFDDNSLAILVSKAYNRQQPEGLSEWNQFQRWRIMSGNTLHWIPYKNKNYIDLVVLDGLYYLAINLTSQAKINFEECLTLSNSTFNYQRQRFQYQISQNYKLGMTAVLASFLFQATNQQYYIDHYISLRSNLLSFLQKNGDQIYSWMVFNNSNPGNLYNTETMALGTLGLSAAATFIYQIGLNPLSFDQDSNFYYDRISNIFKATVNNSKRGYLVYGVNKSLKPFTNYTVQFILRVQSNQTTATVVRTELIEVEGVSNYTKIIRQTDFLNNNWTSFKISLTTKELQIWDFRLYWLENISLDCSIMRIKEQYQTQKKQKKRNISID